MLISKQLHLLIQRILGSRLFRSKPVVVAFGFILCAILSYSIGQWHSGKHQAARLDAEQLVQLTQLKLDEALKASASKDISLRMTNAELTWLQQENKKLADEKLALLDELNLYRKVFRDGSSNETMTIDTVELLKTNAPDVFRFRITLIQHGRFDRTLRGELSLSLIGIRTGQPVQFDTWALLSPADKASLQFNFRYLQTIEGIIQVPQDVQPEQLELQAQLKKMPKNKSVLSASYEWSEIIQPDFR